MTGTEHYFCEACLRPIHGERCATHPELETIDLRHEVGRQWVAELEVTLRARFVRTYALKRGVAGFAIGALLLSPVVFLRGWWAPAVAAGLFSAVCTAVFSLSSAQRRYVPQLERWSGEFGLVPDDEMWADTYQMRTSGGTGLERDPWASQESLLAAAAERERLSAERDERAAAVEAVRGHPAHGQLTVVDVGGLTVVECGQLTVVGDDVE